MMIVIDETRVKYFLCYLTLFDSVSLDQKV